MALLQALQQANELLIGIQDKPKEVGKLEKPRAKGVLKRPAAKTPVKRPAAATVQTRKRATEKIVAIWRGKRVLVNKNHLFSSSDGE